jgi:phosphohistidine phosphatase
LRELGVAPDVILTSPLVRAVETARIVVAALRDAPEPREVDALAPDTPPADTVKALRLFARSQELMIVGHEPNLSSVVALLLTGTADGASIGMKKGGCAALELTSFAPRGGATLCWLLPPRALRLAGR